MRTFRTCEAEVQEEATTCIEESESSFRQKSKPPLVVEIDPRTSQVHLNAAIRFTGLNRRQGLAFNWLPERLLRMLRKIAVPVLAALLGMVAGGVTVDYIHRHSDQRMKQAFVQKERCRNLANRYIRENSKDETSLTLEEVDFSPASNSCIAAIWSFDPNPIRYNEDWRLVDLVSGKETLVGSCGVGNDCGNGRNIHIGQRLEIEFKSAIDGTQPPPDTQ
jgi:hypothetical protein